MVYFVEVTVTKRVSTRIGTQAWNDIGPDLRQAAQKQKSFRLTAMSSICKAYITVEFYFILRLKAWIFRDNIPECLAFRDEHRRIVHILLLGQAVSLSVFKTNILKLIRPLKNDTFCVYDPKGIKRLFQLRVGLSPLNDHKEAQFSWHAFWCM